MTRKPRKLSWLGVTRNQARLLDHLDVHGDNAWTSTPLSDEVMPRLMADIASAGLTVGQVKDSMASVGYSKHV